MVLFNFKCVRLIPIKIICLRCFGNFEIIPSNVKTVNSYRSIFICRVGIDERIRIRPIEINFYTLDSLFIMLRTNLELLLRWLDILSPSGASAKTGTAIALTAQVKLKIHGVIIFFIFLFIIKISLSIAIYRIAYPNYAIRILKNYQDSFFATFI